MKGKKREKKEKSEITKHTLNNLRHTSPLSRGNPHVTAQKIKMADDREPPALFEDEAETPETNPDEQVNGNPFIGETTEITLDDEEAKADTVPEESDKGSSDLAAGGSEEKSETSAAASVDVTNLSKPSEDDSEPAPTEKPEVVDTEDLILLGSI